MSLNTYMDNNYNTLVEEHYYNSACDKLNDLITDFNELTEDNKNKICISVALQQRGWDIQTEEADISNLPEENSVVDIIIYSQSLMGYNWKDYIVEGKRVLKEKVKLL